VADDVICNQCGHRNSAGANFCSSCGTPLTTTAGADRTTTAIPYVPEADEEEPTVELGELERRGVGMLVVKRGPNVGSRFALESDVVRAGRHPDSDIFLDDITVSRRHVEIRREEEGYVVHDVGSLNGTYVNRERVERRLLRNGDELQIGTFKLVYIDAGGGGE
jgi:pSer/pThr/pTyr-binding forkhead associated (FHA) protein